MIRSSAGKELQEEGNSCSNKKWKIDYKNEHGLNIEKNETDFKKQKFKFLEFK